MSGDFNSVSAIPGGCHRADVCAIVVEAMSHTGNRDEAVGLLDFAVTSAAVPRSS